MSKRPKPARQSKPGKSSPKPSAPQTPAPPPELRDAVEQLLTVARESPDGWGAVAQALKESEDLEPDVMLEWIARNVRAEAIPLFRGAALDPDDDFALAALRSLPLMGTRAAAEALVEIYQEQPGGDRGRAARQGVEALQARGINVTLPEAADAAEDEAAARPSFQIRETWETFVDGVGGREAVARLQDRYGVWQSVIAVWNDRAGVKEGFVRAMSRREWAALSDRQQGAWMVQVPADYLRWQIARARALNEQTGFPLGEHLQAWDLIVGETPEGYTPPDPTERVRNLGEEELSALRGETGRLWELPSIKTWAVEPADVATYQEEWEKLAEAGEEGDAEMDALLGRAADEQIDADFARLIRERLLDTARKLQWERRERDADIAAAIALQLETARPGEVELCRMLIDAGLEMLVDIQESGEDPEALRYDPMATEQEAPDHGHTHTHSHTHDGEPCHGHH